MLGLDRRLFAILGSVLVLGCIASPLYAASFFFESSSKSVVQGEEVDVTLVFDGQGEVANALEGVLVYDPTLLQLRSISDAGSILSFWVEHPSSAVEAQDGEVVFSGIAPGGIGDEFIQSGTERVQGKVFKARFNVRASSGPIRFSLDRAVALRHDGSGSALPLSSPPLELSVTSASESQGDVSPLEDVIPPETFIPVLSRDPSVFNGEWFVAFSTQDQGGGVAFYEVQEGDGAFIRTTSPYHLSDQSLRRTITIKAVDAYGNVTLATISPSFSNSASWYFWCIIVGVLVLVAFAVWMYRRFLSRT